MCWKVTLTTFGRDGCVYLPHGINKMVQMSHYINGYMLKMASLKTLLQGKMVPLGANLVINRIRHEEYASEPRPLEKSSSTSGIPGIWICTKIIKHEYLCNPAVFTSS